MTVAPPGPACGLYQENNEVTRLIPLALLALLAACDTATFDETMVDLGLAEPPPPPPEPTLPPEVARLMPPGTPVSSVTQDATGCYIFSIERTDPPTGYLVRDTAGNPVCAPQPEASG